MGMRYCRLIVSPVVRVPTHTNVYQKNLLSCHSLDDCTTVVKSTAILPLGNMPTCCHLVRLVQGNTKSMPQHYMLIHVPSHWCKIRGLLCLDSSEFGFHHLVSWNNASMGEQAFDSRPDAVCSY